MTMTETRPEMVEETAVPSEPRPAVVEWLSTSDHRRIGVAYLYTALLFLLVGGGAAMVLRAELADAGRDVFGASHDGQVFTLHAASSTFLFLAPLWVGFATVMVPLQIGARRLALPRLHALAYWLYLGGGVVVVASYLVDGGPFMARSLLVPDFTAAAGGRASDLWILGMGTVTVAALLAGVGIVTTVALRRASGLTLLQLPPFTYAALVSSTVIVLAAPVFLAGLVLLWVQSNYGGAVFDGDAGLVVWQHVLSIYGRPELYAALLIPALGAVSEIVPAMARRALVAHVPLLAGLTGVGMLSFLVWTNDTNLGGSEFLPVFNLGVAAIFLPVLLVVLVWAGTLGRGRPRPTVAMLFGLGFLLALLVGGIGTAMAATVEVEARSQWVGANAHLLLFATPIFAALGAFHLWAPRIWGRFLSEPLGYLSFLLVFAGSLLAFVPAYLLEDQPLLSGLYRGTDPEIWSNANLAAAIGAGLLAMGLIVFLANLARSVWAGRGRTADGSDASPNADADGEAGAGEATGAGAAGEAVAPAVPAVSRLEGRRSAVGSAGLLAAVSGGLALCGLLAATLAVRGGLDAFRPEEVSVDRYTGVMVMVTAGMAALSGLWALYATRHDDHRSTGLGLGLTAGLIAAAGNAAFAALRQAGFGPGDHPFGALFFATVGSFVVLCLGGLVFHLLALGKALGGQLDSRHQGTVSAASAWAVMLGVLWIGVYVVLWVFT